MFRYILPAIFSVLLVSPAWAQQQNQDDQAPLLKKQRVGQIDDNAVPRVQKRIKSLRLTSVGLGPYGSGAYDHRLDYGFSWYKHFEPGVQGEILLGLMGVFGSTSTFVFGGVGGSYFFSTEDTSPLIGAELGLATSYYHDTNTSTVSEGGFAAKLNAGVRFFRTSDTQMEILATYGTIFTDAKPNFFGAEVRVLF